MRGARGLRVALLLSGALLPGAAVFRGRAGRESSKSGAALLCQAFGGLAGRCGVAVDAGHAIAVNVSPNFAASENFQTPERTEGPDPEGPGLRGAGGPEKAGGVGGGVGGVVSPGFEGASARPSASSFDDLLEDYIE